MVIKDIIEICNFILLAATCFFSVYQFFQTKNKETITPIISKVINKVFIPYRCEIGLQLFRKVTIRNYHSISCSLTNLNQSLEKENLKFYVSPDLIFSLEKLYSISEKGDYSKKTLKIYNKEFKLFSRYYFEEQNKFRDKFGLSKYYGNFRLINHLYGTMFWVWKFKIKQYSIVTILSILYLAFLTYASDTFLPKLFK